MPDLKFFTKGEVCAASQGRMDGEWQSDGTGLQPFCDMRDNTWGVAPGIVPPYFSPSANGAPYRADGDFGLDVSIKASIPHICLIIFHPVFLEEHAKLFLERTRAMMFFLLINVGAERPQICRSNRKATITPLP